MGTIKNTQDPVTQKLKGAHNGQIWENLNFKTNGDRNRL